MREALNGALGQIPKATVFVGHDLPLWRRSRTGWWSSAKKAWFGRGSPPNHTDLQDSYAFERLNTHSQTICKQNFQIHCLPVD